MKPSETSLKSCCCLTSAKKESVSLFNTHSCGCESEGPLFFSPPMLQMMLLSHTAWFCSFLHSRTEPMAESAVGFIQHHLNWVKLKGALCICSSPWAAKGKSGQSWDHTQRGWAQHPDSSWDLSTMLCPSDAPYLQGAMVAWCGVWYVVVTYQRIGPA